MIKTMAVELKQICNDCKTPSISFNNRFVNTANAFFAFKKYHTEFPRDPYHNYDRKSSEDTMLKIIDIDSSTLQILAIFDFCKCELPFKKSCQQTAIYMCDDYQERAKNIFYRRKYTKCLVSEQKRLNQIREEINELSETIKTKEIEIESLCPNQYSKAMFILSCCEYYRICSEISKSQKKLTETHSQANKIIYEFVNDSLLSIDSAKKQFDSISKELREAHQKLSDQLLLLNEAENKATALADQIFIKGSDPIVNGKSEKGSDSFGWVDEASWY